MRSRDVGKKEDNQTSNVEAAVFSDLDQAPKARLSRYLCNTAHFVQRDGAVDVCISDLLLGLIGGRHSARFDHVASFGDLASFLFANMCAGMVLFHDMDEQVFGDILGQPFDDLFALLFFTGHDEMADYDALFGYTVCCKTEVTNLIVHGFDTFHSDRGVVIGFEQSLGRVRIPDLKVGQIDINKAVEKLDTLE